MAKNRSVCATKETEMQIKPGATDAWRRKLAERGFQTSKGLGFQPSRAPIERKATARAPRKDKPELAEALHELRVCSGELVKAKECIAAYEAEFGIKPHHRRAHMTGPSLDLEIEFRTIENAIARELGAALLRFEAHGHADAAELIATRYATTAAKVRSCARALEAELLGSRR